MLTKEDIKSVARYAKDNILDGLLEDWQIVVNSGIDTPIRQAHFLAQIAHESDGFHTTREYSSGAAYEGRRDLGNVVEGDGRKFRGRGLIQLTGRANYAAFSKAIGFDLEAEPEKLEQFPFALEVSVWYWNKHNLNALADDDDIVTITRKINGGYNGLTQRKDYLEDFKDLLGVVAEDEE